MPLGWVEDVVLGRWFTFLPPMRASQLRPIDDMPKPMSSLLNYPASLGKMIKNLSLPRFSKKEIQMLTVNNTGYTFVEVRIRKRKLRS